MPHRRASTKSVVNGIPLVLVLSIFFLINPFGYSQAEAVDIPVGFGPNSVAINQYTNKAVVANELSNSVSIVDLSHQQVISTSTVGCIPTAAAIDKERELLGKVLIFVSILVSSKSLPFWQVDLCFQSLKYRTHDISNKNHTPVIMPLSERGNIISHAFNG